MTETELTQKYTPENKKDFQENEKLEVLQEPVIPSLADYTIHGVHKDHPNVFFGRLKSTGLEVVVKGSRPIGFPNYEPEAVGQICLCYEHDTQAKLDHNHILSPLELYYHENKFYLVTPKVGECDLNPKRPEIQALSDSLKLTLLAQIASALAYCHKNDVVHLDVKGRNIRKENKKAILIDFGAARRLGEKHEVMDRLPTSTPEIIAPEYRFSQTATPSADVFSLSCLAYKLMTGRDPFVYDDVLNILIYRKPSHNKEAVEKFGMAGEAIRKGMSLFRDQRPDMAELEGMLKEEAAKWDLQPSEPLSEPSPVSVQ